MPRPLSEDVLSCCICASVDIGAGRASGLLFQCNGVTFFDCHTVIVYCVLRQTLFDSDRAEGFDPKRQIFGGLMRGVPLGNSLHIANATRETGMRIMVTLLHSVSPVASLAVGLIVAVAWMGLLGYGLIKLS